MRFIKFPFLMRRKRKIEILDTMIEKIRESDKKRKCTNCKRKFEKGMTKWGNGFQDECLCLLCHKEKYFKHDKDFPLMEEEKTELRKLKTQNQGNVK